MDPKAATLLQTAAELEAAKNVQGALEAYVKALGLAKTEPAPILFPMAEFLLRYGEHQEALDSFKRCHVLKHKLEDVERIVLGAYHQPNVPIFKELYEKNRSAFDTSGLGIDLPPFDTLRIRFLPYSESRFACFDAINRSFTADIDLAQEPLPTAEFSPLAVPVLRDMVCAGNIMEFVSRTDAHKKAHRTPVPVYLVHESKASLVEACQIQDFSPLIESGRVVFLFGMDQVRAFFAKEEAIFPTDMVNVSQKADPVLEIINQARKTQVDAGQFSYLNLMLVFERFMDQKPPPTVA